MRKIYITIIGLLLIVSCSKSSIEQEQDLCKDAKSVPQITFVKLSNTFFSNRLDILGNVMKQDSIAITFKYQDAEADIGINPYQKIFNVDGSKEVYFADILKKNTDGTFTKLILKEPINLSLFPVPTKGGLVVGGSSLPFVITSLSSCSGEITCSLIFSLALLSNIGLKIDDRIKFQIYIRDRALHSSNTIETNETTLSENP
jgi:hypothetical protein